MEDTKIIATGSYLPTQVRTAVELEQRWQLEPGWIARRTGVLRRRIAAETESTSDLAVAAAQRAMAEAAVRPQRIRLLVLATSTPDHLLPPSSVDVAHRLGLRCPAYDLAGACCGFLLAMQQVANSLAEGDQAIVIGANTLSRRVHESDQDTASIFADGAGAVVLEHGAGSGLRLLKFSACSDGAHRDTVWIPAGGAREPLNHELLEAGQHLLRFGRGAVGFRRALELWLEVSKDVLDLSELDPATIDHFLPHQANARLLALLPKRLHIPAERMHTHLERYGNTSAASIAILLDEGCRDGLFKSGDRLLLSAAGAGLAAAAMTLEQQ